MIRIERFGHGNTLPNIGDRFFLATKKNNRRNRIWFIPAGLVQEQRPYKVYYSIRSAAILAPFESGQAWEVQAVRLRRIHRKNPNAHVLPSTIVRIDLLQMFHRVVGRFDHTTMTWDTFHDVDELLVPMSSVPARVEYREYTTVRDKVSVKGYYPEVIDASSGAIIIRFSSIRLRALKGVRDWDTIAPLPDDGVPFTKSTDPVKGTQYIVTPDTAK